MLLLLAGCKSKLDVYKEEAQQFCEVHNPSEWKAHVKKTGETNVKEELDRRVNSVVITEEFKKIVDELNKVEFMRELYSTAQAEISKLIQDKWECVYYREFYTVRFERSQGDMAAQPSEEGLITIVIDADGNITISSMELMDNQLETLRQGIETIATESPPKIVIKTRENTPKSTLNGVTGLLYKMGVRKATIISD